MIIDRSEPSDRPLRFRRCTNAAAFRQAALTNLLNPKVALFFLAFLPQFIDPASPTKLLAFLTLGLTFVTTGTIWCLVLAWLASAFSERLRTNGMIRRSVSGTAGALFVFSASGSRGRKDDATGATDFLHLNGYAEHYSRLQTA